MRTFIAFTLFALAAAQGRPLQAEKFGALMKAAAGGDNQAKAAADAADKQAKADNIQVSDEQEKEAGKEANKVAKGPVKIVFVEKTTTTDVPFDSSFGADSSSGILGSLASAKLRTGVMNSDSSGSDASLGSFASGSSGSFLPIWEWFVVAALLGVCLAVAIPLMGKKKAKKTKKKAAPAPAPTEEPLPEVAPLLLPEFAVMPSYPMTTSYAAPMSYAQPMYAAAPATTAYAAPVAYAGGFGTTTYAAAPQGQVIREGF